MEAVLKLRDEYSHWGKDKLVVLLLELPYYALSDALSWSGFESCLTKEFGSTTELSLNL